MPKITVDPDKCDKDGICSRVCVARIISKPDKDRFPEIIPELAEYCLLCGHCVAACPTGALDHDLAPLAGCQEINRSIRIEPDAVETLLKIRRSVRLYEEKAVPHALFERLMEAGRYAPTGSNRQDVQFLICEDQKRLKFMAEMVVESMRATVASGTAGGDREKKLKRAILGWEQGQDTILRNAPALILAHSNILDNPSQTNGIIAMGFVELMAHALGLGACYCGYFNNPANNYPPLKKELGLPEGHSAAVTLLVGYPKITYHRIPPRNEAKYRFL